MTHREPKKELKQQNKQPRKPTVISSDDVRNTLESKKTQIFDNK